MAAARCSAVVEVHSDLSLPAERVWERMTTLEGIRHELGPVVSMTTPPGLRGRSVAEAGEVLGRPLGRAWVLVLRVLPVEYDAMTLVALEPGRRFHERSSMASLRRWEHERTVEPCGEHACRVSDRLTLEPRRGVPLAVARRVVAWLFRHRHRRLRAWAGRQPVV